MSYVTFAQNQDASAFKALVEESLASKVVMVLEGLKVEVASQFFNEEGGISGGVSSVKKKPTPPAAGTVELPDEGQKTGTLVHAGRSGSSNGEKTGEFVLPGQEVHSEEFVTELSKGTLKSYANKANKTEHKIATGNDEYGTKNRKLYNKIIGQRRANKKLAKEEKSHGLDKVKAVQKDKSPKLPQKKGSGSSEDRKSMN
jgi:hypothetical protein